MQASLALLLVFIASVHASSLPLRARQSPGDVPDACTSQCAPVVDATDNCTDPTCACTTDLNNALLACLQCTAPILSADNPSAFDVAQAALSNYEATCQAAGIPLPSLTLSQASATSGAPSQTLSGSLSLSASESASTSESITDSTSESETLSDTESSSIPAVSTPTAPPSVSSTPPPSSSHSSTPASSSRSTSTSATPTTTPSAGEMTYASMANVLLAVAGAFALL